MRVRDGDLVTDLGAGVRGFITYEARRFVAGKVFAFTCFDGTRGAGRVLDDLGAAGSIQFSGAGPIRHVRLPRHTLQICGQAVCASIKGLPFEPCFNLDKRDDRSFRGSVSGMSFAYCDFRHQGASQMLMARARARPRSLHAHDQVHSTEASSRAVISSRVETPRVESAKLEPVKSETKAGSESAKSESAKSEPAKSESAKSKSAKSEPAKSEPAKSEPAKSELAKSESAPELRRSTD